MKILLVTAPMPAGYFTAALRAVAPELDLVEHDEALGDAELAEVEAAVAWRFPPGLLPRLPRLRWVCAVSAGVDKLLVPELAPSVMVSRIVDPEQAEGIAQYVVAMALRQARGLADYEGQQRRHEWRRRPVAVVRSTVGVLGAGATGGTIARLMAAVGFRVRTWRRSGGEPLEAVLASSEIVVCALPLTPATASILDARAFAAMPRGACLINIARGEHVAEADLMAALRSGHLAGAVLDVQGHEPMAADDPLWDAPGLTITPHIAAQSRPETVAAQVVVGLRALERGETPPNTVDRARGY